MEGATCLTGRKGSPLLLPGLETPSVAGDGARTHLGTFTPNREKPIHRWYPYLQGYSFGLIEDVLEDMGPGKVRTILDPFCGSGTTALVASALGLQSWHCETNPFMRRVIEAKINAVGTLRNGGGSAELEKLLARVRRLGTRPGAARAAWDGFEKYFEPEVLSSLLALKKETEDVACPETRAIAMVLLASVLVRASKMMRHGDLRFARRGEKDRADRDILCHFVRKLEMAIADIRDEGSPVLSPTACLSEDCRDLDMENGVDCVITSPPYLNGTNYARNLKLEMKLFGFLTTEADLAAFHSLGVICGINNVSKRNPVTDTPDVARPYVERLGPVAYDGRIPLMVAGYFRDMDAVISKLARALKHNGRLIMDIGDSQFADIHIPTHDILAGICTSYGFSLTESEILRERRSKNGMLLSQRLLKFRLHKEAPRDAEPITVRARAFTANLPYKAAPYSGRLWGHPWHSLCSYHGKLKPAIAHFLVERFTRPGDVVVDPLCGVGTIPLEACLQGRTGIGNDLSELAFCVSRAKLEKPDERDCRATLEKLAASILETRDTPRAAALAKKHACFGFNGKLADYFHEKTFREILCAREFFRPRIARLTPAEAMVLSCLLHVLHGNRPYALSRNSHPLTPYAPTGDAIYKDLVDHVRAKLDAAFARGDFTGYTPGKAVLGDFSELPSLGIRADAILCSPPFAGSLRFYMQNWMRLWLCGWEKKEFRSADIRFLDRKQQDGLEVYAPFFRACHAILRPGRLMVLHLGRTKTCDMADRLAKIATPYFTEVHRAAEDMRGREKHGVRDKGTTVEHQFLFLERKEPGQPIVTE